MIEKKKGGDDKSHHPIFQILYHFLEDEVEKI